MVRREAAEGMDASARKALLQAELTGVLRGASEVEVLNSPDWNGADAPLVAQLRLRVALSALQRKQLAQQVFQAGETALFPASTRANAIDFRYPWQEADEVRVGLPADIQVEKLAPDDSLSIGYARYRIRHKQEDPHKLYSRRDLIIGTGLVLSDKYKDTKDFFDKIHTDDNQPTVLQPSPSATVTK